MKKFSLLFLLLFIPGCFISAQESDSLPLQEEADPFYWDYELGSSQVDLFLDGFWNLRFSSGLGLAIEDSKLIFPSFYPGMSSYAQLEQTPDLLLNLWIENKYYMEVSFVKDYDKNTYALGFMGEENQFIQHIRLANSDLPVQGFGGFSFPSPRFNTPGLLIAAEGNTNSHELLARLDGSLESEWIYQGKYLLNEEILNLHQWISSRFFVLPHSEIDRASLEVYVQHEQGNFTSLADNIRYKRLQAGEYTADLARGLISFPAEISGNILVYYEKGAALKDLTGSDLAIPGLSPSGNFLDLSTATTFGWNNGDPFDPSQSGRSFRETSQVELSENSRVCLYLKKEGRFSPFEFNNGYGVSFEPSDKQNKRGAELVDKNTLIPLNSPSLDQQWGDDYIRIYSSEDDIRSLISRYPLWNQYPEIYGPSIYRQEYWQDSQLRLYTLLGEGSIKIPASVIEGSLEVTLNGHKSSDYHLNQQGELIFNRYILPSDRIVIRFREENPLYEGGEILVYQGNQFRFNEKNQWETGAGFLWSLPEGNGNQQEGTFSLSTAYSYQGEHLQSQLSLEGFVKNPDTSEIHHLAGMEKDLELINIYPGILQNTPSDLFASGGYVPLREYSFLDENENLQDYDYPQALLTSKYAPSAAAASELDQVVMLMPYSLDMTEWTGGALMLSSPEAPFTDLSSLQEIQFSLKLTEGSQPPEKIYLYLGQTGESADQNGDQQLNPTDRNMLRRWDLETDLGEMPLSSDWTTYNIILTDQDRIKLESVHSLSLVIAEPNSSSISGGLLLGNIQLLGRGFVLQCYDASGERVSPQDKGISISAAERSAPDLLTAFPETRNLFHSQDQVQRAVEIRWNGFEGIDTADYSWKAQSYLPEKIDPNYRYLNFYIKSSAENAKYLIQINNNQGQGMELQYIPGLSTLNSWQKVTLDLHKKELINPPQGLSLLSMDDLNASGWSQLKMEQSGSTSGSIYLDEFYLEESLYSQGADLQWDFSYSSPFEWLSPRGYPIFSSFYINSILQGNQNQRFSDLNSLSWSMNHYIESGMKILGAGLKVHMVYGITQGEMIMEGGHQLTLPDLDSPLVFMEAFQKENINSLRLYSAERSLNLELENNLESHLSYSIQSFEKELEQQWNFQGKTPAPLGLEISLDGSADINALSGKEERLSYSRLWLDSWGKMIPADSGHISRESNLNPLISRTGDILNLQLNWIFYSSGSYASQWTQEGFYGSNVKVPFTLGKTLQIEYFYNREKDWSSLENQSDSFLNDWTHYGASLGEILPLFHEIPYWEIFSSDYTPIFQSEDKEMEEHYLCSTGFSIARPLSSNLLSWFLPSLIETEFGRKYRQKTSEKYNETSWKIRADFESTNIFGDFGTYPLFHFYLYDTFYNSLDFYLSGLNSGNPSPQSLEWKNQWEFKGKRESISLWENQFKWDWVSEEMTEQLTLSYQWRSASKDFFKIPFSQTIIDQPFYAIQKSKIEYNFLSEWIQWNSPVAQEILLSHHWILNFSQWAIMDNWFALGYSQEKNETLMGCEIGIEIQVKF